MSISRIPKDQMSHNYHWLLLEGDYQKIRVRPFPSYDNEEVYCVKPGGTIYGKLYRQGLNRNQLEHAIGSGNYQQQHFFVILKDRSGCVAVVGKVRERILKFIPDMQQFCRQRIDEIMERDLQARIARRKAEKEARHQRHMELLGTFLDHLTRPRESSGPDNSQEIERLRGELRQWKVIAASDGPYIYQMGAEDNVREIRNRIWDLERQ